MTTFTCPTPKKIWFRALEVHMLKRCGDCPTCLALRRHQWACRAAREQATCKGAWFVTVTFGGATRAKIYAAASLGDQSKSSAQRLFKAAGDHVSRYVKRLRKAGLKVRYIAIAEPHANGFPHFHMIIFDQDGSIKSGHALRTRGQQLVEAVIAPQLEALWKYGRVDTDRVRDVRAIWYVTKYLAKEKNTRVRASFCFGGADTREEPAVMLKSLIKERKNALSRGIS